MCGIIGYIGNKDCKQVLLDCLKKLEYRGYDSSGIATIVNRKIEVIKCAGKISSLEEKIGSCINKKSRIGIGHTRWATHGIANDINAHPHEGKTCVLVHNGIIENHEEIRNGLKQKGHVFYSEVDSEVIAKLLDENKCNSNLKTLKKVCNILQGSFALNIVFKNELDKIYVVKKGSPLIIGLGTNEKYICSDINSVSDYCKDFIYLEECSYGVVAKNVIDIYDFKGNKIKCNVEKIEMFEEQIDKNGYAHFMLKEIEEEPLLIENILKNNLENGLLKVNLDDYKGIKKIIIIGCGTAMHAGLIAKYYLEKFSHVDVDVEIASEYRYKDLILNKNTLAIFISQSGETADTLACLKMLKDNGIKTLSFVNVYNSSIAKLSDKVIYTCCGKEIAIASTKALIGQVLFLILFTFKFAYSRRKITINKIKQYNQELYLLPKTIKEILHYPKYKKIAKLINKNKKIIFIGRSVDYYLGLEACLKLKEITYIPCQCYQAGELKHGPISLIDDKTLIFVLNTNRSTISKTLSNMQEVKSRNGNIYVLSNQKDSDFHINDTPFSNIFSLITIFQLIAYNTALVKNLDVDKPRNLAKSVTVE